MSQKICVINNGDETDFAKLLKSIVPSIDVTVLSIADVTLSDSLHALKNANALDAIILTGSTRTILNDTEPVQLPAGILDMGVPVLGICYGFHWMVQNKGGVVEAHADGLLHSYNKYIAIGDPLKVPLKKYIFEDRERVAQLPADWSMILKYKGDCMIMYNAEKHHMGVQFYPEKHDSTAVYFYKSWLDFVKAP